MQCTNFRMYVYYVYQGANNGGSQQKTAFGGGGFENL